MNLSINPLYKCNFRCDFCYLTPDQLKDKQLLNLDVLISQLETIHKYDDIDHIDLYGGEIGLLSEPYSDHLMDILTSYTDRPINIITNFSVMHPIFFRDDVTLSVSYDFDCREKHEQVLHNIIMCEKDIHILLLAGSDLLSKDVHSMINVFNSISNIQSVEIKPYSTNQANNDNVTFADFEEFIKKWILDDTPLNFQFINTMNIHRAIDHSYHSWSNDHLYITPTGTLAVLEFDSDDNEYFKDVETIEDYIDWTKKEVSRISKGPICGSCEYLGHCLSEHLRDVKNLDNSCNGFKHLLDWYNERS